MKEFLIPRRMFVPRGCAWLVGCVSCADRFFLFVLLLSTRRVIPKTLMTPEVRLLPPSTLIYLFRLHVTVVLA